MGKIIFAMASTKICKIILDDDKINEILEAKKFIIESKWPGEIKVPIDVIIYDDGNDDDRWNSFASVFSTGGVDLRHEWYEGDESYLNFVKDLFEIEEKVYITPELVYNLLNPGNWKIVEIDYNSFKKKASKVDIKLINRELMKKKLEGDPKIVD